jgi:hypothetical protein
MGGTVLIMLLHYYMQCCSVLKQVSLLELGQGSLWYQLLNDDVDAGTLGVLSCGSAAWPACTHARLKQNKTKQREMKKKKEEKRGRKKEQKNTS